MEDVKYITIEQFCQFHRVETNIVEEFVEYGIVSISSGQEVRPTLIPSQHLHRLEKAVRLYRDLGVNAAGIDIILNLLDRMDNRSGFEDY